MYKDGDAVLFKTSDGWQFGMVAHDHGSDSRRKKTSDKVDVAFLVSCPSGIRLWKTTVRRVDVYKVDPEDLEFYPALTTTADEDIAAWRKSQGLSSVIESNDHGRFLEAC